MTERQPNRLIAALDTNDLAQARSWAAALAPSSGLLKLGLEFFLAHGPDAVANVANGHPYFLDLKLHDIPNTVAGAVRAVARLEPAMLTLHAAGGAAMIEAARNAAEKSSHRPLLLAVTVLTSLDDQALAATGITDGARAHVLRLGALAIKSGADGLVCSAHEVAALRDLLGPEPVLVVPGIRPKGAAQGDQARTMTPAEAMAAGADYLVVGRPITQSAAPAAAARAIVAEIASCG